ncbi:allB1 Probable allantoinase 1 [Candida maltosa Xu316]
MALPAIEVFKASSQSEQKQVFDHLFEPCDTLANFIFGKVMVQPFSSYQEFIELVRQELIAFVRLREINPIVNQIIAAHPRLGEPKKEQLSVHSSNEQKSLNGDPEVIQKLKEMNETYEKTFPGLRYVVFVNGRSRHEIMDDMTRRINRRNIKLEREEAFNAMCDIALDRAHKLGVKL